MSVEQFGIYALVGIACVSLVLAIIYLKKQTAALRGSYAGKPFDAVVGTTLTTIDSILTIIQTTTVQDLKEKSADGKLTKEELLEVVEHTKQEVLKLLGDDAKTILVALVGDYQTWLQTVIMSKVTENAAAIQAEGTKTGSVSISANTVVLEAAPTSDDSNTTTKL